MLSNSTYCLSFLKAIRVLDKGDKAIGTDLPYSENKCRHLSENVLCGGKLLLLYSVNIDLSWKQEIGYKLDNLYLSLL